MSWNTFTVTSWLHFVEYVARVGRDRDAFNPASIWRGQSDAAWKLTTRIQREFAPDTSEATAYAIEKELLKAFQLRAHVYLRDVDLPSQDDIFSWWSLMQHYGVPTRALDWTESPFVAAYFAVRDHWDRDGAIFVVPGLDLTAHWENEFRDVPPKSDYRELLMRPDTPRAVIPFYSWRMHAREVAQQGRYTIPTYLLYDLDAGLPLILGKKQVRIIIPAAMKRPFLVHLRSMNVTAAALFPGLDGLGRTLAESASIAGSAPPLAEQGSSTSARPSTSDSGSS